LSIFLDRRDAGRRVAALLHHLGGEAPVVLGLPRGGVPVAYEVALALGAAMDVLLVRKLGAPQQPELALGAIGEGGALVRNEDVLRAAQIDEYALAAIEARERQILEQRAGQLRDVHRAVPLRGRLAVIVDDGVATGATARAACQVARERGARRIVLAAPIASSSATAALHDVADEITCVEVVPRRRFLGVSQFYEDFSATSDKEVDDLLRLLGRHLPRKSR
jgi:putative phosphoribosyl transferase